MAETRLHIFGVRHHGPGSARSLKSALKRLQPDCVLIEGPPDAQDLVTLAGHTDMDPPVALLVYAVDDPQQAVFYPFATFSPSGWRSSMACRTTYRPGSSICLRSTGLL